MEFSAIFKPTNLFSLKDSNFTNSGAKSLMLPSPYAIKMALINQAIIHLGTKLFEDKKSKELAYIKDTKIEFCIKGNFCVNNTFVTIQSMREGNFRGKPSFREYIFMTDDIEIIFRNEDKEAEIFLKIYIHKMNYFGKRGCFFQFVKYIETSSEPNVKLFNAKELTAGILQEFDDIDEKSSFENINNYSSAGAKRKKNIYVVPAKLIKSSKSYTHYRC